MLRLAARGFGLHEPLAQARCVVAEAEVALALRELGGVLPRALLAAAATLEARADRPNAAQRWLAPSLAGFTTILLLPAALPPG